MPAVGLYVFRVRTATGVVAVRAGESVVSGFDVEEGFFCAEGRCEGKPYFVVMRVVSGYASSSRADCSRKAWLVGRYGILPELSSPLFRNCARSGWTVRDGVSDAEVWLIADCWRFVYGGCN